MAFINEDELREQARLLSKSGYGMYLERLVKSLS
jgi:hypothetical protein